MVDLVHVGMRARNFEVKNMKCRNNGNTEVGYLSKPEGTTDMGTKWAMKRDTRNIIGNEIRA